MCFQQMDCTGTVLILIKRGIQRSAAAERNPHAVDLTFIQMSCWISLQFMEINHLLTASAKWCRLKLELPQILLLFTPCFNSTCRGWLSTLHCWLFCLQLFIDNTRMSIEEKGWASIIPAYFCSMSFNKLLCKEYPLPLAQESVLMQFYVYFKQKKNSPWRERKIWTMAELTQVIQSSEDVRF